MTLAEEMAALRRPAFEHVIAAGGWYDARRHCFRFPDGSGGRFVALVNPYHAHFIFKVVDTQIAEVTDFGA
jgi:hypothetical protein